MFQDFMMRMFTLFLWQEKRDEQSQDEVRPLSFAKLRMLLSCGTCERSCCGLAS